MLIACPECKRQISDKAISCPHCGYPISKSKTSITRRSSRRMRLPNGFGQITEIKNKNLRSPFRAMITIGKTDQGKPICKILDYYKTYNDAYQGIMEYHKNPYELSDKKTVNEVFDLWFARHSQTISDNRKRMIQSTWKYCTYVYDLPIKDLKIHHIKECMENGTNIIHGKKTLPTQNTKNNIKIIFNMLLDYAVEYEMITSNVSRSFVYSEKKMSEDNENTSTAHIPFTDDEMNILWENIYTTSNVDIIIFQCYTGLRPQEIGLVKIENVNLASHKIICGMKTSAGKNRTVPIHPRIYNLVCEQYKKAIDAGSEYLFFQTFKKSKQNNIKKMTYSNYRDRFNNVIQNLQLNPEHKAHDPRKHFVTMAKKYKVDEYAIKYIVGHTIKDLTERVYTKRDDDWLLEEIKKIK